MPAQMSAVQAQNRQGDREGDTRGSGFDKYDVVKATNYSDFSLKLLIDHILCQFLS